MYKYAYKAIDDDGKIVKGTLVAEDNNSFINQLKAQNIKCFDYKILNRQKQKKLKKLKTDDLIAFSTQLSSMLVAGLPLAMSLEMLYERTEKKKADLKKVLAHLLEQVQKGESLASAMAGMGETFPQLYKSMIKSGEMNGKIDETLVNLASHYDKEKKKKHKIKSATNYPKILMGVCVLVVTILLIFVLPKMTAMLPPDKPLPVPTQILLNIKDFVVNDWAIILLVIIALVIVVPIYKKIPAVALFRGKMATRIPKLGKLKKMVYTATFARSLATLYQSGVSLLDAMQMSSELMGNAYIEKQIQNAVLEIRKGVSISEALSKIDSFDPLLTTMIFVGEQSGALEDILIQTADYFDEESNTAIDKMISLINPVLLIFMAIIVGFVLIAIMMPMFSVYDSVGGM